MMVEIIILVFVMLAIAAICGEFITAIFVALLIVFIAVQVDTNYYTACTDGGHSYLQCFYDRIIKVN